MDPSYKMDLDFLARYLGLFLVLRIVFSKTDIESWDCFGREKLVL